MKKKLVMKFTDESSIIFQLSVIGLGEFGLWGNQPTIHTAHIIHCIIFSFLAHCVLGLYSMIASRRFEKSALGHLEMLPASTLMLLKLYTKYVNEIINCFFNTQLSLVASDAMKRLYFLRENIYASRRWTKGAAGYII